MENAQKGINMDWLKKHTDTVIVVGSIITCMLWMNGKFNEMDKRFYEIDKEISIIKTVLVMKGVMPTELAKADINE